MNKLQAALAALAASAALGATAQVGPSLDYTDMWWNPDELGWGISIRQKLPAGGDANTVDALFAVWYTYDPRAVDPASPGGTGNVPLWIVMPGGTWVSPTRYTGRMYVLSATPYSQPWVPAQKRLTDIGSFRFDFSDSGHGVFTYAIVPPPGLPPSDPAYGLTARSGTKSIERQSF
jgi:hypothetical protein